MSHILRQKLSFKGHSSTLAGLLERGESPPKAYVLFAHCFTCGKDIPAASRISKALVRLGFAVLRFDFTGLGNSDGDFSNSNFSSNVEDLIQASNFLRDKYEAPQILVGHSLGGAAVLKAADKIPEAQAVVSIAAPANAQHIAHLLESSMEEIEREGKAKVLLEGREFTLKKQFIEDIDQQNTQHLSQLKRALLILHSPLDEVVSIKEAEKIYTQAKHPKSFVSLDSADHLLSNSEDSEYAAGIIACWSEKFLVKDKARQVESGRPKPGHVVVSEIDHKFQCKVRTDGHQWIADEPIKVGGQNFGPDPYEQLLAALGSCTVMTLRMYADFKKLPLTQIEVELSHKQQHCEDCTNVKDKNAKIDVITRIIQIEGDLDSSQKEKLLQIADKCPVHKTLHNTIQVHTEWK